MRTAEHNYFTIRVLYLRRHRLEDGGNTSNLRSEFPIV